MFSTGKRCSSANLQAVAVEHCQAPVACLSFLPDLVVLVHRSRPLPKFRCRRAHGPQKAQRCLRNCATRSKGACRALWTTPCSSTAPPVQPGAERSRRVLAATTNSRLRAAIRTSQPRLAPGISQLLPRSRQAKQFLRDSRSCMMP